MCLALGAIGLTRPANAEDPEPVLLEYEAASGCPDRAAFAAEIQARTARVSIVGWGATARTLRVSVRPAETGFTGELELSGGSEPARRVFEDAACDEVVEALGLVAALALDPAASIAPRGSGSVPVPPEVGAPESPASEPAAGTAVRPESAAASATHRAAAAERPAPAPPSPRRWRAAAGAGVVLLWGPAPELLVALAPSLELELERARGSVLSVRIRFTPLLAQTGVIGSPAEFAVFRLLALRTELCPLLVGGEAVDLGLCARSDIGALMVEGQNVSHWNRRTRPWASLGAGLDFGWHSAAFIRISGGLAVPLTLDRFVVGHPREVIHEPDWLGGTLALIAGVRFP